MTDQQLIDGILARNPLMLDAFYQRYRALMFSTAAKFLNDEWELEEVVQDVVWTVWRKMHTFRGDSSLSTWVYRVTQNAARMLLRKKKRVPMPMEQQDMDVMVEQARQGEVDHLPDAAMRGEHVARHIETALSALPAENRELFLAMDVRGETKEDVADRLGLSISALKARLHRVRKQIRRAAANPAVPAMAA